jgi:hypothetical protein
VDLGSSRFLSKSVCDGKLVRTTLLDGWNNTFESFIT